MIRRRCPEDFLIRAAMFENPKYILVPSSLEKAAREVLGQLVDYDYDDLHTQFDMLTKVGIITKTFGEFVSNYKLNQQETHCVTTKALKMTDIFGYVR